MCSKTRSASAKPLFHVALAPGNVGEDVVDVRLRLRQTLVAAHPRVQCRSVRLHGLVGVEHRIQLLVLNVDEQQRLFSHSLGLGRNRGHLLADEPHHVPGQHRHVPQPAAHQRIGQVGGGDHRMNSRHRLGR